MAQAFLGSESSETAPQTHRSARTTSFRVNARPAADDTENVRQAARITPDDRLLVETDCPYLAPVPHRGKRNEPSFMVETVRRLAEVRGTTPQQIADLTTCNFERLCLRREWANG